MKKAPNRLRFIGLLALLAGFMSFGASLAQAEGDFLKNGVAIAGNAPLKAKAETTKTLSTKVGLAKVEISCPKTKLVGANLEVGGLIKGKIHFDECITKLNGSVAAKCAAHSPGAVIGLIETNALTGSLRLHALKNEKGQEIGKDELIELSPEEAGTPFMVLILGTGECAIGNELQITGTLSLQDCKNEFLVDKTEHLLEEGPLSTLRIAADGTSTKLSGTEFWFLGPPNEGSTFADHV